MPRTPEEFLDQIEACLSEGRRGPDLAVSRLMEPESWDEKVEELSRIITDVSDGGPKRGRTLTAGRAA